jgi:predicted Zn-dependent protease
VPVALLSLTLAFVPAAPVPVAPASAQTPPPATAQTPPPGTGPTPPASAQTPLPATAALPEFGAAIPSSTAPAPPPIVPPVQWALPDLGDASQADMSPRQERKLGEAVVRQIRASGGYMNDPEVNDYLNNLGRRLAFATNDGGIDFEFFAVPDPTINAFALPGGFVGVNTGLILLAQSESELASVLAHEISHVTQHHLARMISAQRDSMLMSLAGMAVAVLAARAGGSSGGNVASAAVAASQAMSMQNQLNFTRANEYEADRIGIQRLVAAGFDPRAMADFMKRLQRATRFSDGKAPSYLRTHPLTTDRIAEAEARAASVPFRQVPDSLDFQMVHALLRSYEGDSREAVAFFDDAIAERKYSSEVAVRYGLVASLLRDKNFARAKVELATLDKIAPPHPMIDAIAGHVYLESGDALAAVNRFKSALDRYPNKMQLVYDYPEALMQVGRNADAAAFIESQIERFRNDGQLHQIAARAYANLNKQTMVHRHLAEYYAWQGDLRGAINQLELAIRSKDGDFFQMSVVEARLRELRREASEQDTPGFGRSG